MAFNIFKKQVRTRFAPAPTGFFHIGSARTALFNYLFAKKNNGTFILRLEDTDKQRSSPEFEKDIIDGLEWLKLNYDEIYRQSERTDIYKKYLEKLLNESKAYCCFCSEEELEAKKQERMSRGEPPKYNGKCAELSQKEVKEKLDRGENYIIRFKTPSKKIKIDDLVRGKVEFDTGLIGDFSIARNLESPLYNFTVVVDDYEMKINYVIRGEDLLPNTPKQILIQEALNFPHPKYGHLPLILGEDRSKLSKRYGATSLSEYRNLGYLPEALINFLAFLGWNPDNEKEIYSLAGLIKDFSIEQIQKAGAVFNIKRLDYLNGFYIRQKSPKKLTELCMPYLERKGLIKPILASQERFPNLTGYMGKEIVRKYVLPETGENLNLDYLEKAVSVYQERLKILSEIPELIDFFLKDEIKYDRNLLKWKDMEDEEIKFVLKKLKNILSEIKEGEWSKENLEKILIPEADKTARELNKKENRGYLLWPLRVALSAKESSAPPFEIAEILGKKKTLKRIGEALNLF